MVKNVSYKTENVKRVTTQIVPAENKGWICTCNTLAFAGTPTTCQLVQSNSSAQQRCTQLHTGCIKTPLLQVFSGHVRYTNTFTPAQNKSHNA